MAVTMFTDAWRYYVARPAVSAVLQIADVTKVAVRALGQLVRGKPGDAALTLLCSNVRWIQHPNSLLTKIQWAAVRYFTQSRPNLSDCQESLPQLPVPNLNESMQRWLNSVEPLLSEQEFEEVQRDVADFLYREGPLLQAALRSYRLTSNNWLSEMWIRGAYLRTRDPLWASSNCFGTPSINPISNNYDDPQIERIARIGRIGMSLHQQAVEGTREPIRARNIWPVNHNFDHLVMGSTRIAQVGEDRVARHQDSRHFTVMANGHLYVADAKGPDGSIISEGMLRKQLRWIREDVASRPRGPGVTMLSGLPRDEWAEKREHLMHLSAGNRKNLEALESSLVNIVLTDVEPTSKQEEGEQAFLGVDNRHWDKSMTLIVTPSGKILTNITHESYDASVPFDLWDRLLKAEPYSDEEPPIREPETEDEFSQPSRMDFRLTDELTNNIAATRERILEATEDLDLHVASFQEIGKNDIKKLGVSPDSFFQMALQLAYYRLYGTLELTYESASTRVYQEGRTETIRSATKAALRMCERWNDYPEEREELLRAAVQDHVNQKLLCTQGEGVDRHIMGLYVMYSQIKESAPWSVRDSVPFFENPAVNPKFIHATSQPYTESLGGGFAPVEKDGDGVCYYIRPSQIDAYITTYRSSDKSRSSEEIADALRQALHDCAAVLGGTEPT